MAWISALGLDKPHQIDTVAEDCLRGGWMNEWKLPWCVGRLMLVLVPTSRGSLVLDRVTRRKVGWDVLGLQLASVVLFRLLG